MSLEISRLENVCKRGNKTTARCPACAESGHDLSGEHLIVNEDGRFGCVVYSGDSPDARAHRRRIFALCGDRVVRPLIIRPASGRQGRGEGSQLATRVLETGILGRLGRASKTLVSKQSIRVVEQETNDQLKESRESVLTVLTPNRPLSEHERYLLRLARAENDSMIIAARDIFDATIVAVRSASKIEKPLKRTTISRTSIRERF